MRVDLESRKHHDTLLPNQKSPVPLNRSLSSYSYYLGGSVFIPVLCRYEDSNGNQAVFLNAGKKPDDCKMVAKALFSFQVRKREEGRELVCTVSVVQAQNNRELAFRKGDIIYVKKQVDNNWYEGERNAAIGIFPVSYVEILPTNTDVSPSD